MIVKTYQRMYSSLLLRALVFIGAGLVSLSAGLLVHYIEIQAGAEATMHLLMLCLAVCMLMFGLYLLKKARERKEQVDLILRVFASLGKTLN